MNEPLAVGSVPQLEELFGASADVLGADLDGYRNHAQRVSHFARAPGAEGQEAERKLAIACYFHDPGIWTDRIFDDLEPSVARATAYLEEQGLSEWSTEISWMIREHHKITSTREAHSLSELFRRADWIDVSLGILHFGVSGPFFREVQHAFPDCGFHRRLVALTLERLRSQPFAHCRCSTGSFLEVAPSRLARRYSRAARARLAVRSSTQSSITRSARPKFPIWQWV